MWSVGAVMNDMFSFQPRQPPIVDETFWEKVCLRYTAENKRARNCIGNFEQAGNKKKEIDNGGPILMVLRTLTLQTKERVRLRAIRQAAKSSNACYVRIQTRRWRPVIRDSTHKSIDFPPTIGPCPAAFITRTAIKPSRKCGRLCQVRQSLCWLGSSTPIPARASLPSRLFSTRG